MSEVYTMPKYLIRSSNRQGLCGGGGGGGGPKKIANTVVRSGGQIWSPKNIAKFSMISLHLEG